MEGNLCSRRVRGDESDLDCIEGMVCYNAAWPRSPASSLLVDVALLDSCNTANFRHRPRGTDSLAVRLLDGYASAVISPFWSNQPMVTTPFVAWEALANGAPLGDVCEKLNATNCWTNPVEAPFVLFGDPEMVAFDCPPDPSRIILSDANAMGGGRWHLDCARPISGI